MKAETLFCLNTVLLLFVLFASATVAVKSGKKRHGVIFFAYTSAMQLLGIIFIVIFCYFSLPNGGFVSEATATVLNALAMFGVTSLVLEEILPGFGKNTAFSAVYAVLVALSELFAFEWFLSSTMGV